MHRDLAVLVPSLVGGGAERVAAKLATHWSECGDRVTLITLDSGEAADYSLGQQVTRIGLDLMRNRKSGVDAAASNLRRVLRLRRAIKRCGARQVVSLTDKMNILALLATRGVLKDVIISERIDPRHHPVGQPWSWLRKNVYPWCRCLVVQTESIRPWGESVTRGRPVHVIPNAAPDWATRARTREGNLQPGRRVVALGRLDPQKGFDLLLAAFAAVAPHYPDWRLTIYGTGPEGEHLERIRRERQLMDRVELPGWATDPQRVFHEADLFVLPSRYEGFPNALLEAMACGVASISFDCDSGPREILRHELDGLLVPSADVVALATAMDRLMNDEALRAQLGRNAQEVSQRFSEASFFRRWDAVRQGAASENGDCKRIQAEARS
jgi:glycosyltransferase involved in cell wall biosynthesis